MVDPYIKLFLKLIRDGSKVNTYKLAWAKALVEIASENPDIKVVTLEKIAEKVFKYYWNQTIYFDLIQGSNPNKRPEFVIDVRKNIESYFLKIGKRHPIHFEKVEDEVDLNFRKLTSILKKDVSWRFPILKGESLPVYQYTKGANQLTLYESKVIAEYSDILFESINYKWTQVLESFNSVPRIAKKVRIIDFDKIKRKSLTPFRVFLEKENPNKNCFICNEQIINETPSIDHVIPWSFLFSDDIWNLVYTHQSCNSLKSNCIPSEIEINNLEIRNAEMLNLLNSDEHLKKKKPCKELEIAIEKDYVRKFWISCRN